MLYYWCEWLRRICQLQTFCANSFSPRTTQTLPRSTIRIWWCFYNLFIQTQVLSLVKRTPPPHHPHCKMGDHTHSVLSPIPRCHMLEFLNLKPSSENVVAVTSSETEKLCLTWKITCGSWCQCGELQHHVWVVVQRERGLVSNKVSVQPEIIQQSQVSSG